MFDILMYLFETMVHSDVEIVVDHDELTDELQRAGFHLDEIYKAIQWLEKLSSLQDSEQLIINSTRSHPKSLRIYTSAEQQKLDVECRGFLMFLERASVLSETTREMVVDRVMEIDTEDFNLDDLKWVILMVLFNVPGQENAYEQMEDLLFEEHRGSIH